MSYLVLKILMFLLMAGLIGLLAGWLLRGIQCRKIEQKIQAEVLLYQGMLKQAKQRLHDNAGHATPSGEMVLEHVPYAQPAPDSDQSDLAESLPEAAETEQNMEAAEAMKAGEQNEDSSILDLAPEPETTIEEKFEFESSQLELSQAQDYDSESLMRFAQENEQAAEEDPNIVSTENQQPVEQTKALKQIDADKSEENSDAEDKSHRDLYGIVIPDLDGTEQVDIPAADLMFSNRVDSGSPEVTQEDSEKGELSLEELNELMTASDKDKGPQEAENSENPEANNTDNVSEEDLKQTEKSSPKSDETSALAHKTEKLKYDKLDQSASLLSKAAAAEYGKNVISLHENEELFDVSGLNPTPLGQTGNSENLYVFDDEYTELSAVNISQNPISEAIRQELGAELNEANTSIWHVDYDISDFDPIPSGYGAKLKSEGIESSLQLLFKAGNSKQLGILANEIGVLPATMRRWVAIADLLRVQGVGFGEAELLYDAGIKSAPHLSRQRVKDLTKSLAERIRYNNKLAKAPEKKTVLSWIEKAAYLPARIEE